VGIFCRNPLADEEFDFEMTQPDTDPYFDPAILTHNVTAEPRFGEGYEDVSGWKTVDIFYAAAGGEADVLKMSVPTWVKVENRLNLERSAITFRVPEEWLEEFKRISTPIKLVRFGVFDRVEIIVYGRDGSRTRLVSRSAEPQP
jgi:hypothetical protein